MITLCFYPKELISIPIKFALNAYNCFSLFSDDDDFYDRTKKKSSGKKAGENQSIETADTLIDKRDAIKREIGDKKELLLKEKNKITSETTEEAVGGDALDAYMSGLSSQLGGENPL